MRVRMQPTRLLPANMLLGAENTSAVVSMGPFVNDQNGAASKNAPDGQTLVEESACNDGPIWKGYGGMEMQACR